jgi:hypothetical protein
VLCERYSKLNTFAVPYETLLGEKLADYFTEREKWQQQQRDGEILFLKHVFERWSATASNDPDALDQDGKERFEFEILRQHIAASVANRGREMPSFLKNYDDVYVRRGYYTAGRFSSTSEIDEGFQRDGRDFLESAIYNDNLFSIYPKGLRATFHRLVEDNPQSYDHPHPGFSRIWDHKATELFNKDPTRYPDPNSIYRDEVELQAPVEVELQAPIETDQQTELLRRLDRIEVIATGCSMILIAGAALWAAWGMEILATKMVEEKFPGQGVGGLAGPAAFIVTLIAVWLVGSHVLFRKTLR